MKTLQDILSIKDKINDIANVFGFENIRICILDNESNLSFIVDRKKDMKVNDNDSYLESMLSIYLECPVTILVSTEIKTFLKDGIMANSAPLNEEESVKRLFGNVNPSNIKFSELGNNETNESLYGLAEIGEEVYKKLTGTLINSSSFWANNKLNDKQLTDEEKYIKILTFYESMEPEYKQKVRESISSSQKLVV